MIREIGRVEIRLYAEENDMPAPAKLPKEQAEALNAKREVENKRLQGLSEATVEAVVDGIRQVHLGVQYRVETVDPWHGRQRVEGGA